MADESIMQLKITLKDAKPPVWRRVLVPTSIRYDQLGAIIQVLFEWTNSHLAEFSVAYDRSIHYVDRIDPDFSEGQLLTTEHFCYPDLLKGSVTYTYDFGDDWEHKIVLEKMLSLAELPEPQLPLVTGGRQPAPEEDSGMMFEDGDEAVGSAFNKNDLNIELAQFSDSWLENYFGGED